jgi:microsomal dipeptidase-like Zn-dependent dipeptidase
LTSEKSGISSSISPKASIEPLTSLGQALCEEINRVGVPIDRAALQAPAATAKTGRGDTLDTPPGNGTARG